MRAPALPPPPPPRGRPPRAPRAEPTTTPPLAPRPLGALLDNVAQGYTYQPVTWTALAGRPGPDSPDRAARTLWQPLVWAGAGNAPPLLGAELLAPKPGPPRAALTPGGAGRPARDARGGEGRAQAGRGSRRGGRRSGAAARAGALDAPLAALDALRAPAVAQQQQQQQQQLALQLQAQRQAASQPPMHLQQQQAMAPNPQPPHSQEGAGFGAYGSSQGQAAALLVQPGAQPPGLLGALPQALHPSYASPIEQQVGAASLAGGHSFTAAPLQQAQVQAHMLPAASVPMVVAQQQFFGGHTFLLGSTAFPQGAVFADQGLQAAPVLQLHAPAPQLQAPYPTLYFAGLADGLAGLSLSGDGAGAHGILTVAPISSEGSAAAHGASAGSHSSGILMQAGGLPQAPPQQAQPPTSGGQPALLPLDGTMGGSLPFGMRPHLPQ
jgi:hypothetical protein